MEECEKNTGEHLFDSNDNIDTEESENEVLSFQDKLSNKDKEIAEIKDKLLRLTAEFDNFRKRTIREKEEFRKYAAENLLLELTEVYDNFERALDSAKSAEDVSAVVKGIEMVFKQFVTILEKEGLKKMECIGTEFDPHEHEAMLHVESAEHDENMVIDVCKSGYYLHSKVLRPASVTVSKQHSDN